MKAIVYFYKEGILTNKKEFETLAEAQTEKRNYLSSFTVQQKVKLDIQAYIKTINN